MRPTVPQDAVPPPAVDAALTALPASDPALYARIAQDESLQSGIETSLVDYLDRLAHALFSKLIGQSDAVMALLPLARVVLWALVIIVPILVIALVVRARRARRGAETDQARTQVVPIEEPVDMDALLHQQLDAGDARAALRTLWLWLARSCTAAGIARATKTQTNEEVVAAVRVATPSWPKLDALGALARQSDVLMYGAESPTPERVRALAALARSLFR